MEESDDDEGRTTSRWPTSGNQRTDLLTCVIAIELFLIPSHVQAIARSWVASVVPFPRMLTADVVFRALLHQVVRGTTRCALSLIAHDLGPDHKIDYELMLFPSMYNLALSRALLISILTCNTVKALSNLHDPRGYGDDDEFPFLEVGESGSHGELIVREFTGDELLHYLASPAYMIHVVCHEYVKALVKLGPVIGDNRALFTRMAEEIIECIDELVADHIDDITTDVADVLYRCAYAFFDAAYNGDVVRMDSQFQAITEQMNQSSLHTATGIRAKLKAAGRVPRFRRELDPMWATTMTTTTGAEVRRA